MITQTHKACRRFGMKICQSDKCPVLRRNYPPGIHGPKGAKRLTQYGTQLREKQIAKAVYGLMEKQFVNYYKKAFNQKGDTGEILQQLLETRLDNVIYRAGFAKTRRMARQMVSHGMFIVNGQKLDIPSYQVKIKDEIGIKESKTKAKTFLELDEKLKDRQTPSWMALDPGKKTVKITGVPKVDDIEQVFSTRLIVEFYSR